MAEFSVSVEKIKNEFALETIHAPFDCQDMLIYSSDVNRPGLNFAGDYDYYDENRIQILGNAECGYLEKLSEAERQDVFEKFMSHKPPLGEGILILGESGVGKSETAIELVKRGHRLIADDAVEIRRVSSKTLVGSSPENIRHFVELRGIGIINVRQIFGIGAVKVTEKIDMVINLEPWDNQKIYDRIGIENETVDILGVSVGSVTIPVKPGRNLAIIIEVAAMSNRQKKMGYNAAEELLKQLGMVADESVGDIAPRA